MDPKLDQRLSALEAKVTDTHDMVRRLHSMQRTTFILRVLYWSVLVGIGIASYGAVKPYLEELSVKYGLPINEQSQELIR